MKFSLVLSLVAAATVVSAATNAERFARGLGPNPPVQKREPSSSLRARRSSPSSGPSECKTGSAQCCNSVGSYGEHQGITDLVDFLALDVAPGTQCGSSCSPIIGVLSSSSCDQHPVCCDNNNGDSLVSVNCSPITVGL